MVKTSQLSRPLSWAAAIMIAGVALQPARAGVLVTESFNYTAGSPLQGLGSATDGWTNTWTALSGNVIANTNLEYSNGDGSIHVGGDSLSLRLTNTDSTSSASRPFNQISGGTTTYFSLLFRAETTPTGDNFIHFMLNNDTLNANSAGIGDLTTTGNTFGSRVGNSNGGDTTGSATLYQINTTYLLVGKVEDTNANSIPDKVTLWVNPTTYIEASPGTTWTAVDTGGDATAAFNQMSFFTFRTLGLASSPNPDFYYIDELRIGQSFADVVPEPGTLALIALAGPALLVRRRRVTAAP